MNLIFREAFLNCERVGSRPSDLDRAGPAMSRRPNTATPVDETARRDSEAWLQTATHFRRHASGRNCGDKHALFADQMHPMKLLGASDDQTARCTLREARQVCVRVEGSMKKQVREASIHKPTQARTVKTHRFPIIPFIFCSVLGLVSAFDVPPGKNDSARFSNHSGISNCVPCVFGCFSVSSGVMVSGMLTASRGLRPHLQQGSSQREDQRK